MAREQPWYQRWFGQDYLQLYEQRSSEEAKQTISWLLSELKLPLGARVLDLACGCGRHGGELAKLGYQTYGIDLSWSLLTEAWIPDATYKLYRLRGDMRFLPVKRAAFDAALSLFTSFGYFSGEADDQKVLAAASWVLRRGGSFVLDFLNAESVPHSIAPTETVEIKGQQITINRWVDIIEKRVEKRISISAADGTLKEYRESVRLYNFEELRDMLQRVSIRVHSLFGNYDGSNYSKNSPRLILIGTKDA